ncbi:MAG: hypothetical protein IPM50_09275 [Acidobacteriota bacterium]|nr:MAG: hypothetical protein IPM50_09275 [Acidobacteriota bacterium]
MGMIDPELPFSTIEEEVIEPLRGVELTDTELFVAGLILNATTSKPIKMAEIIDRAYVDRDVKLTSRQVRIIVRSLRRVHGFPICTRKGHPAGYWWGRSEAELEEFVNVWKAQYLDEITTLHTMIKINYPRLAGQLKLALEE